jgi:SAM-dependent methyltransferase
MAYSRYVLGASDDALILNLGSGNEKTSAVQRDKGRRRIINLDIFPHGEAHIVADGHYLPFVDQVFDGVYMFAVLEHVSNPFVIAQEVARVLKPGGFVLAAAPFIHPRHSSPSDYFRFTDDGLRQLFSCFREIECGAHGLPTRGLIEFLRAYVAAFSDNRYLAYALTYIVSYLFFPLKYLDKYLQNKKSAHDTCSSFYYVGLKEPVEDA